MHDLRQTPSPSAHLVALAVAANGRIDDRELSMLEGLDAFRRLGVSRPQFHALAQGYLNGLGRRLAQRQWLGLSDRLQVAPLLRAVEDPGDRLTICRLAAAVIIADGRVTADERALYRHLLATWGISETMVAHAIMVESRSACDPSHPPSGDGGGDGRGRSRTSH